jgi:hypothetical protein
MKQTNYDKAKLKVDKSNGDLQYNDEHHIYFNKRHPDRKYTSVTTLIGKYYEKFDSEFWSAYKSMEALMGPVEFRDCGLKSALLKKKKWDDKLLDTYGIDREAFENMVTETLLSYKKTSDEACEYGTTYHNAQENKFYSSPIQRITDYNFGLDIQKEFQCERNNFDLNREHAILPEYLAYYSSPTGIMNMAGQIDILVKNGNDLYILDFKTNKKGIETKAYFDPIKKKKKMMYAPLSHIEDTTLEHYTLQLSIYAYMLQQINPEFNIKLLRIIHVDREGNETLYDLQYRKEDVKKLFKHYEKQIIIEHYRKTGKLLTSNKDYFDNP